MKRAMNFNPGPAVLPLPVLQEMHEEFFDFAGTGMSILEISHRSAEYEKAHNEAITLMKEMLGIGDNYKIIFVGGGASTQFAHVPLNFLKEGQTADYVVTGAWAKKALKEAKLVGKTNVAATTEVDGKFTRIPKQNELKLTDGAAYVHITTNNTIFGTQYHYIPETKAPLIADMSSDFLWKPTDGNKFAMIYAGAQKNLGPAGVTVAIIRDDFLAQAKDGLPTMFSYKTHVENNSLYNTPPVFGIYIIGKVLNYLKKNGGLTAMEKLNRQKGDMLYNMIDKNAGFYKAPVDKDSRSYMNIVFRLPSEELEKTFVSEAKKLNMVGIKGHRSVGGIRVSTYNAVSLDWVKTICDFMAEFVKKNG